MNRKKKKHQGKKGKRVLAAFLILLCLGIAVVGSVNGYVVSRSDEYVLTVEESAGLRADCVLVLGAGLVDQFTPSDMLADRIDRGVEVYRAGAAAKLLMSGDHGSEAYDEVNVMKARAVKAGVPSADVFMDHAGFSTYESVSRAKEIFGAKKIVIVTQKYHLFRAIFIARQLGLDAWGVDASLRPYRNAVGREVREVAARCKDFLLSITQPAVTGGEKISLAGSGDGTNDENTPRYLA